MSFIVTAPVPEAQTIVNDSFWPDVDTAAARAAMRLDDGTVAPARLSHALVAAMVEVECDLAAWKSARQAEGHKTLADVPAAQTIDGVPLAQHCYLRAVYCYAKASLIERMADYDLTAAGQRQSEQMLDLPAALRRDGLWAIARILGRSRATVDLI